MAHSRPPLALSRRASLLLDFLQKLPKYAFEEDEVACVTTKKEVEALKKALEDARKAFPELCEPNSN
jgi:hypothetical protein